MGKTNHKFTWVIKDFSSLRSVFFYSDWFVIGGCKWRLRADLYNNLSLYLYVGDSESLPCGWTRPTKCGVTIVNQLSDKLSHHEESQHLFYEKSSYCHLTSFPLAKLKDKDGGYVVNNEVKIVVDVDVFEVVEKSEEEATQQPLKKIKLENGSNELLNNTLQIKESVDVNGFLVLPSQVELVRRILDKRPDMALGFRSKNQHLRSSCMNVLLTIIETVCQSLQAISDDDLRIADNGLAYVKDSGFKVDWLEKKLEEVKKKKKEEQMGETKIAKFEKGMKEFKEMYSKLEALREKEKAKVVAARASPLTFDDVL